MAEASSNEDIYPFFFGDVGFSGNIDVRDAILVLRSITGLTDLSPSQAMAADVNQDESVGVGDAILILRHIVGLTPWLPQYKQPVVSGNTIRVPEDYNTIQAGIATAAEGDMVLVAPGIYSENIDFLGKSITVASEAGPPATIIDGGRSGSVVTFHNGEDNNAVLYGFMLTNGLAGEPWTFGGGVSIINASPTLSQLKIHRNAAGNLGGGIYVEGEEARPVIRHNQINFNLAQYQGGGIEVRDGAAPMIWGNTISGNLAEACGGIKVAGGSSPDIQVNVIQDNVVGYNFNPSHLDDYLDGVDVTDRDAHPAFPGGILVVQSSSPVIKGNTLTGNAGGGIGVMLNSDPLIEGNRIELNSNESVGAITGGILVALDSKPELRNNIIRYNKGPAVWVDDTSLINDGRDQALIAGQNEITGGIVLWPLQPPEREGPNSPQTIHVPGDYNSIQEAIDSAAEGDTVIVYPETYHENIDFLGKQITVRSENPEDPEIVAATVIEADEVGPTVTFIRGEGREAILDGFTILNQFEDNESIYLSSSGPTIRRNIISADFGIRMNHPYTPLYIPEEPFTGPYTPAAGVKTAPLIEGNTIRDCAKSGIYYYYASPEITGNLITGNGEDVGANGGLCAWFSHPVITGNTITGNKAGLGGGLYFENFSRPVIMNNTITNNTASLGGGIYFDSPTYATIDGNVITGNRAAPGAGIAVNFSAMPRITNNLLAGNTGGALFAGSAAQPHLINNTLAYNYQGDEGPWTHGIFAFGNVRVFATNTIFYYSDIAINDGQFSKVFFNHSLIYSGHPGEPPPGEGSLRQDPLFVDADSGDYRLQDGSPCINTGIPVDLNTDLDGNERPQGQGFDMGAYEYMPQ